MSVNVFAFYTMNGWRYMAADGGLSTEMYDSKEKARRAWYAGLRWDVWRYHAQRRYRVVSPYLYADTEKYVGKICKITKVIGIGALDNDLHVRVRFDGAHGEEVAFPMRCLEPIDDTR